MTQEFVLRVSPERLVSWRRRISAPFTVYGLSYATAGRPFGRWKPLELRLPRASSGRDASLYNCRCMDRRDERRQGTARVVGLHADDGSFDREFWRGIPPKERLELVWAMTLEARQWRGERGGQPRLQRSVCRVERRGR